MLKLPKKLIPARPEKLPKKRVVKTAIWYDPFGSLNKTTEEQIDDDIEYLEAEYGPFDGKLKLDTYIVRGVSEIKPKTELVLFDYGVCGMGNDLMGEASRSVIRYALDNPSVLIIVTSTFTYNNSLKIDMEDLGLASIPNIMEQFDNEGKPPDWWLEKGSPSEKPVIKEVCQRCKRFADHYGNDGQLRTCADCGKHICEECFVEKPKKNKAQWPGICGDCAGWN